MPRKLDIVKANGSLDERLLTAAVEVFLEKGFTAASVDEIAARAKASKLTFYTHYGNKEALFEAVVRRQNRVLEDALGLSAPEEMDFKEFLETVAHRLYRALLQSDNVRLMRVLHAEAVRFPKLANVFDEAGPARAMRVLAVEMEKQMARGTLRKTDSVLAAEHFLHLTMGELTRRILLGVRPVLSKSETYKRVAAGIDTFLRAYGANEHR